MFCVAAKMEYDPRKQALGMVACCMCGVQIEPNNASMCGGCLSATVDISAELAVKDLDVRQCGACRRFLNQVNNKWGIYELESARLLALCLKRIPSLDKKVKLVDASWVWTEPHSKRLKIKLTVRKEVEEHNNIVLQQSFIIEYVVRWQQCSFCNKSYTGRDWQAVVQVRQKGVAHKRTMLHLEQLILRRQAHKDSTNIVAQKDGVDFYFIDRHHASKFVAFLASITVTRATDSSKVLTDLLTY